MYYDNHSTNDDIENLRSDLLHDIYAGAFAGMPAMLTEENRIRNADADELLELTLT